MKKLIFIIILLIPLLNAHAQEMTQKSRRELKKEKQAKRQEEVKQILKNKNFVFRATQANPLSGGSIQLDFSFDARVKGDTIVSYLPYYGVAYYVEYSPRRGPFDFTLPIKNYSFQKGKKGYTVTFEVKKQMDVINYTFHVSENGYATLNISSINRQTISYYGTIEKPEKKEKS